MDDVTIETTINDGNTSCMATSTASDLDDNPSQGSYAYEAEYADGENMQDALTSCALTSCVGTSWFRAPELRYGSIDYGQEVDLRALGCIFAELLTLESLFPGASDIDRAESSMSWETCPRHHGQVVLSFQISEPSHSPRWKA